ncbi:MAG: DUF2075 domain-containing protein [Clostridia bacterium]|nr:DUF2075 domain-containing protein [Clostridia bacterium]
MLGYISTIHDFLDHSNVEILQQLSQIYPEASDSQVHSWEVLIEDIKNSPAFSRIPDTAIIGLELSLFVENMSADLVIAGTTITGENIAFLIESKQWGDDYIQKHRFSSYRESNDLLHPQIQVHHHFLSFRDYIKIAPSISHIYPLVYMRNASQEGCDYLQKNNPDNSSKDILIFNNIDEIFDIAADNLARTTPLSVRSFNEATYYPSLSIIDAMNAIVTREVPFILTAEQERVLQQILVLINSGKRIIQINGGAGSGKTAILLNIYVRMLRKNNRYLPFFVSGAQNTYLYRNLYPQVSGSFNFSFSLRNIVQNLKDGYPIILLDEAQHNQAGIISELLSNPSVRIILCYDEWQTINANNALAEFESFRERDDFASINLSNSVRFNGSQVFETNVKSFLTSARPPSFDDSYDFRVLASFDELKTQTYAIINSHPEYEVALMGLLSDDAQQMAKASNGFMHANWDNKAETSWVPYLKRKNYLSKNKGSLWIGTWWMPGLDVDYAVVIVGNDAKITNDGFKGCANHSKNYGMIISVAQELGLPDRLIKENSPNHIKAERILDYITLGASPDLKKSFHEKFTYYLRNMYYVMMTRGRKGCLVYFKNQS